MVRDYSNYRIQLVRMRLICALNKQIDIVRYHTMRFRGKVELRTRKAKTDVVNGIGGVTKHWPIDTLQRGL